MIDYSKYEELKAPVWIITLDNQTLVLPNGKCAWSARRFAKSALSHFMGVEKCDEALASGKFKIVEING